jgi:hypothetical protein
MRLPGAGGDGNDREGFSYLIEAVTLAGGIETSRVALEAEPIDIRAEDALEATRESSGDGSKLAEAMAFLRVELERGPVSVKHLQKAADGAGIFHDTNRIRWLPIVSEYEFGYPKIGSTNNSPSRVAIDTASQIVTTHSLARLRILKAGELVLAGDTVFA